MRGPATEREPIKSDVYIVENMRAPRLAPPTGRRRRRGAGERRKRDHDKERAALCAFIPFVVETGADTRLISADVLSGRWCFYRLVIAGKGASQNGERGRIRSLDDRCKIVYARRSCAIATRHSPGFVGRNRSIVEPQSWRMDSKGRRTKREMVPPYVPSSATICVGTTTRSGRSSVPALDFGRTESGPIETSARDPCVRGWQSPRKSALLTTKSSARRGVTRDVSDREDATVTCEEQQVPGDGFNTPPVLNWWRNQRLTEASADELSQDPPSDMTGSEAGYCSPALKVMGREPCQEEPWTKTQLRSLRRAQADTDPSASNFWGAVAHNVEGRDPLGCQQKWFEHFATPQGRRRKVSKRGATSGTPLSEGALLNAATAVQIVQPPVSADDLFQATPMRGRRQLGVQLGGDELGGSTTPRTPAGPGATCDDSSRAGATPGDGHVDYKRGVSRTYVQAMSKKMRKGASQLGAGGCMTARGKASRIRTPSGGAGRTIHAATVSRGHKLKVSVTSSGAVNVASTHSDEDSLGLSDGESDEE